MPDHSPSARKDRCAYAFYATNDTYAVAALVFARRLQELGVRPGVDLLILHHSLSQPVEKAMGQVGIAAVPVAPLKGRRGYFRDSLTKLRIFDLVEYDRLVFADVDAWPLKPLDYLFDLPTSQPIAAPAAYWLTQPCWTTALLVVEPSPALSHRIAAHLDGSRRDRRYDMDIINTEFRNEIQTLPAESFCLNSEWEDRLEPGQFPDVATALATVSLVHFSALGKPWSHSPQQARRRRPRADPTFYGLFEEWRAMREDVLAAAGLG